MEPSRRRKNLAIEPGNGTMENTGSHGREELKKGVTQMVTPV